MKTAREIVKAIVREIEERVYSSPDNEILRAFEERHREIEKRVLQDFTNGVTRKHVTRIRKIMGNEFMEVLNQGRIGPIIWKGKDRLQRTYQRLALLIELYLHYQKEAQGRAIEAEQLRRIRDELIESQVSHVHEIEVLEDTIDRYRMLLEIVLAPFEEAMKRVMSFLKVKHLEVFLFDDDRFLATEMKTDGQSFLYNQEEEDDYHIPEAVSEVKLHEVKEISLEVPLIIEGQQIGHYRIWRQASGDLDREEWKKDVEWITPVLARIIEANRNRLLARRVYIDDLTQLYNKRKLNEQMGKLFKQFKRGDKELHVAMIDIDRFKHFNDTYGHPVGDEILKRTAAIIKEEIPYAYRYGGEEFAGVFYGYDRKETMEIMERVRRKVEKTPFVIKGQEYRITISAGIARFETYMNSVMDAFDRADQALYASKEDGRNRCTYYDDIKDRLITDVKSLRQEILKLKEQMELVTRENRRLVEQLKRDRSKKGS
jgi:diguanylate cyclase (GGDEF)-like protein